MFSQIWGAIIPLTPYLQLRTDQTLRGAPLEYSLPTMGWLCLQFLVFAGLLVLKTRKSMHPAPVETANAPEAPLEGQA